DQSFFEKILAQGGIGHCRTDAILAEAGRFNVHRSQDGKNRGRIQSVALQLYDDE
ncbi:hypothetical protein EVA_11920, partial [gut metagenome]